jgi:hypothetical protein
VSLVSFAFFLGKIPSFLVSRETRCCHFDKLYTDNRYLVMQMKDSRYCKPSYLGKYESFSVMFAHNSPTFQRDDLSTYCHHTISML